MLFSTIFTTSSLLYVCCPAGPSLFSSSCSSHYEAAPWQLRKMTSHLSHTSSPAFKNLHRLFPQLHPVQRYTSSLKAALPDLLWPNGLWSNEEGRQGDSLSVTSTCLFPLSCVFRVRFSIFYGKIFIVQVIRLVFVSALLVKKPHKNYNSLILSAAFDCVSIHLELFLRRQTSLTVAGIKKKQQQL